MRAEFRVARIFGVDILLHWSIFGLVSLAVLLWHSTLGWLWAFAAAVIFVFSILFHEMAHALAAKKLGIPVKKISLFFFGGGAHLNDDFFRFYRPKAEFLMTIAGPLSSLLLAGIFYALSLVRGKPLEPVFSWLFVLSVLVATFNMLPLFPLDGGRIFRSVLCALKVSLARATKIAAAVSTVLGVLLVIISFGLFGIFSGIWISIVVFLLIIPATGAEYSAIARIRGSEANDES